MKLIRTAAVWGCFTLLAASVVADEPSSKSVLLIAGSPSHGYGAHEHYAGMKVLEAELVERGVNVKVVRGWPTDEALIDQADAISIYCDGGGRHLGIEHLDRLESLAAAGVGLSALHYATETVPGKVGERWLKLFGGHFEIHYSVNPHWTAKVDQFPDHPITKGLSSLEINDEWYFHLKFMDKGVTPILSAVAPASTMSRPDGHHSGNPEARISVAAGEPQVLAWAYDRPDGGRSFGFTGGHHHWNWGDPVQRQLVTQAIMWTAGIERFEASEKDEVLSIEALAENQDYPRPDKIDLSEVAERFELVQ